jgi:hypothetical protein
MTVIWWFQSLFSGFDQREETKHGFLIIFSDVFLGSHTKSISQSSHLHDHYRWLRLPPSISFLPESIVVSLTFYCLPIWWPHTSKSSFLYLKPLGICLDHPSSPKSSKKEKVSWNTRGQRKCPKMMITLTAPTVMMMHEMMSYFNICFLHEILKTDLLSSEFL